MSLFMEKTGRLSMNTTDDHMPHATAAPMPFINVRSNNIWADEVRKHLAFADLAGRTPFATLCVSRDGTILYANRGSWLLLSHWKCEAGKSVPFEWTAHVNNVFIHSETIEIEEQIGIKTIQIVLVPSTDLGTVYLFCIDITERKTAEQKLILGSQVFDNVVEAVMITDADGRILDVNNAFSAITYYTREDILGENVNILRSGRHDDGFYRSMWNAVIRNGNWQGELWDRRKNGEIYPKWMSISAVAGVNGRSSRYVCLFSDISTLKQTQEQLYNMAHYDSLTGLPNRRNFLDRLELTLEHAARSGETVAVMFMDLDDFKFINDHLGHAAGDALLREAAVRLRQSVREADTVARMGGDEFTAILPTIDNSRNALSIAQKILGSIAAPMTVERREITVTASIGIAIYPDDAKEAGSLLQNADTALYRSKELGKNSHQFFSLEMNTKAMERLTLQTQLRHALTANEFLVYYQPQIHSADGRLVGLEALARWQNPDGIIISAEKFIDIAEETGLIQEIGDLVLREVCRQGTSWINAGIPPLRIAVNISATQLKQTDFVERIETILAETGFSAEHLEFELTERVLIEAAPETLRKIARLKAMKSTIAVDDFGTKYSSLSCLTKLPIDRLKIDRSFIHDPMSVSDLAIAAAIVAMGRSLNLGVIAEGVETEAQAIMLREHGCELIQGFYCSAAVSPSELYPMLMNGGCKQDNGVRSDAYVS
ncbi:MAG: EAL domain-containing protein [Spirochaetota bacterium]